MYDLAVVNEQDISTASNDKTSQAGNLEETLYGPGGAPNRPSGARFTETENVAVRVLDVEIKACPGSFFERLDHCRATRLQLAEQISDTGHGNVRVQMLVLFPVRPVGSQFRRMLEVDRASVTPDARIERLILKIELEAELVTIVRNGSIKIVDEKLRGDPRNLRSTTNCQCGHLNSSTR